MKYESNDNYISFFVANLLNHSVVAARVGVPAHDCCAQLCELHGQLPAYAVACACYLRIKFVKFNPKLSGSMESLKHFFII